MVAHRVDIDGLRALAVIGVILFHADLLQGGFVGVDIFFVISGYLMASIIDRDQLAGKFSFANFYMRRMRRIIPALAFVILMAAFASCFVMFPYDIKKLGRSIIAVSTFTSNIWFRDIAADYFAAGNVLYQPMLHTWSLAVEAQFYLLFPWLILLATKLKLKKINILFGLIVLVSFAYSAYTVKTDPQSSFYLLNSRMWELLAGAIIYFLPAATPKFRSAIILAAFASLLGVLFFYYPTIGFPGVTALLPVGGAALILWLQPGMFENDSAFRKVLTLPPITFTANISYSLYLWHWPLFVFVRYSLGPHLPLSVGLPLLAASVILAWGSWRFVEQPFMKSGANQPMYKKLALPIFMIAVLLVSGVVVKNIVPKYTQALLPQNIQSLLAMEQNAVKGDCTPAQDNEEFPCRLGVDKKTPTFLLWGNSFARMWAPGVDALAKEQGEAGRAAIRSACKPVESESTVADCTAFNNEVFSHIQTDKDLKTVILAGNWEMNESFVENLQTLVHVLKKSGKRVYFVLNPPHPGFAVPRTIALATLRGEEIPFIERKQHEEKRNQFLEILRPLEKEYGLVVIDPTGKFCDESRCSVRDKSGEILYYDNAHVAKNGAVLFRDIFIPVFK